MTDILVVDDEPDIRTLIGDILEDEGHGVRMAWDSDSALGEIDRAAPDLIILDIWLKDSRLDGIDILKRVRRDNPAIPVVIISGHGNIEIAVAAIKQGAYDFIEKPFNIDQLMVVIGRALETSRLRRENAALKGARGRQPRDDRREPGLPAHEAAARQGGAHQQPGDADRPRRLRQGGGGALPAPQLRPRQGALRHRQLGLDRRRADGGGALRPRERRARRRAGAVRARPHRHPLLRRGGRHAAGHPVEDPARAGRPGLPAGRRRQHRPGRRAGDLGHDPRPRARGAGRPLPHRALPPAERGAGHRPRPRGAPRGHPRARAALPRGAERRPGPAAAHACRPRPRRSSRPCAGRATSASSATPSSAR